MSPRVLLSFAGKGQDVRLTKVEFWDRNGGLTISHSGRTIEGLSFTWTVVVRALSMLFVKTVVSVHDPNAPPPILSGGRNSPAHSLDLAIAKGDGNIWLSSMFGSWKDTVPRSKVLFQRQNTHLRNSSLPVTISIDAKELPHENIAVRRDGLLLEGSELSSLQEDIGKSIMYADILEPAVADVVPPADKPAITFKDRYRAIWNTPALPREKIRAARALLGTAVPRPYIYLLYSLRVIATTSGDASLEFEIVICNCSPNPLSNHQHEFKFEHPQEVPFRISASGGNSIRMDHDLPHHKFFFIEFPRPIAPGDTWGYRFSFTGSRMFRSDHYWDFSVNTITNNIQFHLSHDKPGGLYKNVVELISNTMGGVEELPAPVAADWQSGAIIHWSVPFPDVGTVCRIRWEFNNGDNGSE